MAKDKGVKTESDLDCCDSPRVEEVEFTGKPRELRGTCVCGVTWTFHRCFIDAEDNKVVARAYSRAVER